MRIRTLMVNSVQTPSKDIQAEVLKLTSKKLITTLKKKNPVSRVMYCSVQLMSYVVSV